MEASSERTRTVALDPADGGVSMPRLLFGLLRQRFTGIMTLEQPGHDSRRVWFRGGMPVFTDWVLVDAVLGELLVQTGLLDATALQEALSQLARPEERRLLGRLLVENGKIERAALTATLRLQLARKLQESFALRSGEAALEPTDHAKGKDDELAQVNVLALVLAGAAAHYDEQRVRNEMGAALDGDLVATQAFPRYRGQFGFRETDVRIVDALCRGGRVDGIVAPGISRERTLVIAYAMWATQMLRTGDDATRTIAHGATAASAVAAGAPTQSVPAKAAPPSAPRPFPAPAESRTAPAPKVEAPAEAPAQAAPKIRTTPMAPRPAPEADVSKTKTRDAPKDEFEHELAELEAKVASNANPFALFGLELTADRKDVRERWTELSTRFHPDALEARGRADLHSRVEPIFAALSEAYGVLSNKDERERIAKLVEAGGTGRSVDDASRVVRNAVEAEMIAREGDKLLKKGAYERALASFERALELSPDDHDVRAAAIWARYQASDKSPVRTNEAHAQLTTVCETAPKCARAHYFRGMILLALRNDAQAKSAFQAALSADRRFVDAERQLRALKAKKAEPEKKPEAGISASLRGWFTKK